MFAGSIHVQAILRRLQDADVTMRRATDLPLRTDFMMRPLTIAAGLWLAPMLLASAQQPAAPTTATAPAAASTAAKPAAASTAVAPAAASTAPAAAAAP